MGDVNLTRANLLLLFKVYQADRYLELFQAKSIFCSYSSSIFLLDFKMADKQGSAKVIGAGGEGGMVSRNQSCIY